jgi:aminoglycoside phosphotransferase (APT) family kinase protein
VFHDGLKQWALAILETLPDGVRLCHFDFHPDQIMVTSDGPKVLDWMTAFQGDAQADVARTLIQLTIGNVSHLGWLTRIVVGIGRRYTKLAYFRETIRRSPEMDPKIIYKWMIPIAAARLSERIKEEEQAILQYLRHQSKRWRAQQIVAVIPLEAVGIGGCSLAFP